MQKYHKKRHYRPRQSVYNIIVNKQASDFSENAVESLKKSIIDADSQYFIDAPDSIGEAIQSVKQNIQKKPAGIIVCGGDGTVSQVARHLIRRLTPMGILPMGRFNDIYRSLYGKPDHNKAIEHILSGRSKKIDYAIASGIFFIGSLSFGLLPEMAEAIQNKKPPRFAIGWSRLASRASADLEPKEISIKVDAFAFNFSPRSISINLLPYSMGLRISPSSQISDGKYEISFDTGHDKAIMSNYIRQIFKGKYMYSDDIRMFRGERIALSPIKQCDILVDGELHEVNMPKMDVEIFPNRIRVMHADGNREK